VGKKQRYKNKPW